MYSAHPLSYKLRLNTSKINKYFRKPDFNKIHKAQKYKTWNIQWKENIMPKVKQEITKFFNIKLEKCKYKIMEWVYGFTFLEFYICHNISIP